MRLRIAFSLALLAALGPACKDPAIAPWLTMPDTASHAAWFPIGPSAVHGAGADQPQYCDGCHFDKGTGLPSRTFRTFTCTGCHVAVRPGSFHDQPADLEALHALVATYAATVASHAGGIASLHDGVGPQSAEDGACRACHPQGWAVNHLARYPLPHQDAAGALAATCTDCHRDPSDRTRLGCAVCHPHDSAATAAAHVAVPGFVAATVASPEADVIAASALCVRCHPDGGLPATVSGHVATSGGFALAGSAHQGTAGGGCLDCHPFPRTDKPFAADFRRSACGVACHGAVPLTAAGAHDDAVALGGFHALAQVDFAGKVAALGFDGACLSCHPNGLVGLVGSHPFPLGDPPSHPPGTCSGCHLTTAARNDPANIDCGTCHLALDPALEAKHLSPAIPVVDYVTETVRCLFCHGDVVVHRAADHSRSPGAPLDGNPSHVRPGCTACHRTARLDVPFAANWGHQLCDPCHAPGGP